MTLRQQIVAQFENPRGAFGRLAGFVMAHRSSNRARNLWTVELIDIAPDDRVLEFGCGPGFALAAAAAKAVRGSLVGLDHSATMIAQARQRNRRPIEAGRVQLVVGSLERLTDVGEPFDKVFSVNVIQFLPDQAAALGALLSVLRAGGLLAITYMPRHRHATRADALKAADEVSRHMRAVGFDGIRVEELPLKPVPAICVIGNRPGRS
jgi:SAM-dependent methyltransferase